MPLTLAIAEWFVLKLQNLKLPLINWAVMNGNEFDDLQTSIMAAYFAQKAQIDALNFLVERLFVSSGADSDKFRADLKKLTAHLTQKYLEQIEGQAPRLAAELIAKMPPQAEIDQSLLDKLKIHGWK